MAGPMYLADFDGIETIVVLAKIVCWWNQAPPDGA